MSMMMLAFFSQKKAYVPTTYTKTFTKNETLVMPVGVSVLDAVVGNGAPGKPAISGTVELYTHIVHSLFRRAGGIDYVEGDVPGWTGTGTGSGNGSDYCDPIVVYPDPDHGGNTVYYQELVCYYYRARTVGGSPATTGASASGFGKVFPGGVGKPATAVTYNNVAVTALASYPVVVPAGGSITITYKV